MDLGVEQTTGPSAVSESEKKTKVVYPDFTLRDKVAKDQLSENECELGEEYTATVRLRTSALRQDEYGQSVSFEVLSMDDFQHADGEEDDEEKESAEEKAIGYKRPKSDKETPSLEAKDLES
jgi:hypothetical protein